MSTFEKVTRAAVLGAALLASATPCDLSAATLPAVDPIVAGFPTHSFHSNFYPHSHSRGRPAHVQETQVEQVPFTQRNPNWLPWTMLGVAASWVAFEACKNAEQSNRKKEF